MFLDPNKTTSQPPRVESPIRAAEIRGLRRLIARAQVKSSPSHELASLTSVSLAFEIVSAKRTGHAGVEAH